MTPAAPGTDDRALLLTMIEEAYRRPTWNGTNLRAALRRVTAEQAGWRPPGGRRSIADIVVHCAYWKYAIRRRLRGERRGAFPFRGSNWIALEPRLTPERWREYLALLDTQHEQLGAAIAEGPPLRLASSAAREAVRRLFGLAIHDAYHTGQVQLLKKLYNRTHSPAPAGNVRSLRSPRR